MLSDTLIDAGQPLNEFESSSSSLLTLDLSTIRLLLWSLIVLINYLLMTSMVIFLPTRCVSSSISPLENCLTLLSTIACLHSLKVKDTVDMVPLLGVVVEVSSLLPLVVAMTYIFFIS